MTNFRAEKILDEILRLTDEQYLKRLIDEPIEKAAFEFEFKEINPVTHQAFMSVTTQFVRHIYKGALPVPKTLSLAQAQAETIAILEDTYQNVDTKGYYAAFLDASIKQSGLEFVLAHMAESITFTERAKHLRWAYATLMDPWQWPERCLIAETLLERWKPFLPPQIKDCFPAQLAEHLPEWINTLHATDGMIKRFLNPETPF